MARTVVGKRVKRKVMGGATDGDKALTNDTFQGIITDAEWAIQEDIRVIGVHLSLECAMSDAVTNADGGIQGILELTMGGTIEKDGVIASIEIQSWWNAAVVIGGEMRKQREFFFPEGYGIDFDESESLNLAAFLATDGAVAVVFYVKAIVYYVER